MGRLGEYIICICCAAMLCGVVNSLMPKGASREILKLVGGLFLAFTVIRPIADLQLPELSDLEGAWNREASSIVSQGEEMARTAAARSIKLELESYILDKAQALHLDVRVQLKLDEDTLHPASVRIIGIGSPNLRDQLISWVTEELGLTEEDVTWVS